MTFIRAKFQPEGDTPGSSTQNYYMTYSDPNYQDCVFNPDVADALTSSDLTTWDYSTVKKLFNVIMKNNRNSTFYSYNGLNIDNEQMILRHVSEFLVYASNPGDNPNNNGIYPYQLRGFFTRGANGTTAVGKGSLSIQRSYNSDPGILPNKNAVISGSFGDSLYQATATEIRLYFNNLGQGLDINGTSYPIFDFDDLKLRFNLGSDALTSSEMSAIKSGVAGAKDIPLIKLNNQMAGKILKCYDVATDKYEDILINAVTNIVVVNENQMSPNDPGQYMPDRINLSVTRGANPISATYNQAVRFENNAGSGYFLFTNAYIQGSQIIEEDFSEDLTLQEDLTTNSGLIELLSETLLLQDSTELITTKEIQEFFQEYLFLESNVELFNYKTILVMFNDLLVLQEKYNNNIDVKVLFNDIIRFVDDYNSIDLNEFLFLLTEVIKFNDSDFVVYNVGRIIELLLTEYFILTEEKTLSKEVFANYQDYLVLNNEFTTTKNSLLSLSENLHFGDLLKTNQVTQQNFEEVLLANCVLMLDGEMYECYSLFMETGAITRYDNYNFNSYCKFNNDYYATSKDSLVKLFNNEENDEKEFEAKFKTGIVNAGNDEDGSTKNNNLRNKQKFLDFGTFTLTSKGQILFTIINDRQEKFVYNLVYRDTNGKVEQTFGSRVRGNFFELELVTNDDLELKDYILYPTILNKYNR